MEQQLILPVRKLAIPDFEQFPKLLKLGLVGRSRVGTRAMRKFRFPLGQNGWRSQFHLFIISCGIPAKAQPKDQPPPCFWILQSPILSIAARFSTEIITTNGTDLPEMYVFSVP